jgi:hypothetical protein
MVAPHPRTCLRPGSPILASLEWLRLPDRCAYQEEVLPSASAATGGDTMAMAVAEHEVRAVLAADDDDDFSLRRYLELVAQPRGLLLKEALQAIGRMVKDGHLSDDEAAALLREVVARNIEGQIYELIDEPLTRCLMTVGPFHPIGRSWWGHTRHEWRAAPSGGFCFPGAFRLSPI